MEKNNLENKEFNFKLSETLIKKELNKLSKSNIDEMKDISDVLSQEVTKLVMSAAEKEVSQDSKQGERIISFANLIRQFGYKLLNLLDITITCSFGGCTLFTWSLPNFNEDNTTTSRKNNNNIEKID